MKIGIDLGHGCNYAGGAVGTIKEEEIINTVGNKVISKLRALGHNVIECRPSTASSTSNSLNKRCATANNNNVELFVSIHANAGGGVGTEIYTYNAKQHSYAVNVLNNICSLGFRNRGIKSGNNLAVINGTKAEAMLIEICFVDTQSDVDLYKNNIENIADAIVKGLVGTTITTQSTTSHVQANNTSTVSLHLRDLQSAYNHDYGQNIYVDGIRGQQVENMLNRLCLKQGSKGQCVGWLQCRVGAGIDDIFGNETKNKVMEFQRNNGLVVDGIAGKNTFTKLLEIYK